MEALAAAPTYDAAVHTVAEPMSPEDGTGGALLVFEGLAGAWSQPRRAGRMPGAAVILSRRRTPGEHAEPMNEREEFLTWVHTSLVEAERAQFNGDDGPRRAIWSRKEPVSVLGAWRNATSRDELVEAFEVLASSFSDCTGYSFELISFDLSGDMAYTVGYERISASMDGRPRTFTLRATQVYRREGGEWRVVHRHADAVGA